METRSRTTKLIVKNVEMLEHQKFDKFDKVIQWLDTLHDFEYNHKDPPGNSTNQQNLSLRAEKNNDFFDSDSSVNTGIYIILSYLLFVLCFQINKFKKKTTSLTIFKCVIAARYILNNRKNKRKSSTLCKSKIKKYRENDVQFEYDDMDDLEDNPGHKLKRLKIDSKSNMKYCCVTVQKINTNEINFNGT